MSHPTGEVPALGRPAERPKPVVLLVDDDPAARLVARAALEGGGFEVAEADDGGPALALLPELRPDCVVLDVMMPGLDGFETCAALRRLPAGATIPVLMMTGCEDLASIERAFAAGATDFATKPCNGQLLRQRLHFMLRASRAFARVQDLLGSVQQANAAKDQFLAVLSHELRNPLTPILAGVQLLRSALPNHETCQRTLEVIERNTKLQARLVSDLLDLSRASRGKLHLQRAPVQLEAVARSAAWGLKAEAETAGLNLELAADPSLWVLGDQDRLQQVVLNLLSNSLKFTPPGGTIRLRVVRAGPELARIEVEDTGAGIPTELLPSVFLIFKQGEVAGRRSPGLGIGLSLVRTIAEHHGGQARAASAGPGRGSCFSVELPLIEAPPAVHARTSRPGEATRVLVVEDNADTRQLVTESLSLLGFEVRAAADAEGALAALGAAPLPHVILSDIGLPGMDGYAFMRKARALPGMTEVLAFALTGFGEGADVRRAREAGFVGHFTKPVDIAVLEQRIRQCLEPHAGAPPTPQRPTPVASAG